MSESPALRDAKRQRDTAIEIRDGVRDMLAELTEARGKLAELARTHSRHALGDCYVCADYDGHNGWQQYPCVTRLVIDGPSAS